MTLVTMTTMTTMMIMTIMITILSRLTILTMVTISSNLLVHYSTSGQKTSNFLTQRKQRGNTHTAKENSVEFLKWLRFQERFREESQVMAADWSIAVNDQW